MLFKNILVPTDGSDLAAKARCHYGEQYAHLGQAHVVDGYRVNGRWSMVDGERLRTRRLDGPAVRRP